MIAGLLDCWIAGLLDCWINGLMDLQLSVNQKQCFLVPFATARVCFASAFGVHKLGFFLLLPLAVFCSSFR